VGVLGCLWASGLVAQTTTNTPVGASSSPGGFVIAAPKSYSQAQQQYRQEPEQVDVAWQFGRACFDRADSATNDTERAEVAQQGIAACRQAVARNPNSAAAHYYLGLNQGELARTESLGALKLVRQMEREFTEARTLDEHLDYAGPDRCLGLLYRDAPSFGSIGSRSKAKEHLQRALQLAPDYPENSLNLAESDLKWGDHEGARRELTALEKRLPAARERFSGPVWTSTWTDWDVRLEAVRRKVELPNRKLEAPRH
jgi:tetratricopeptide (TPR) repeat protein